MEPLDAQPPPIDERGDGVPGAPPMALLEHLLGALRAVVFVFDASSSRLTYVSPHVGDVLGYEARELRGDPELLRRAVHPEDGPRAVRALGALLRGKVDQRMELRMVAKGGREVWVDAAVRVVREDGRARHVLGVVADITQRKRLEQALRESLEERVRVRTARQAARLARTIAERDRIDEERRASEARFEAFAANAIESIVIAGDGGEISAVNARAEALFGRSAAELVGQPLTILMPPRYREAHRRGFARYLETGQGKLMGRTAELSALRADGTEVPIELSLSSFRAPDGRVQIIGLLRDITDRKNAEAALRRTNEELRAARVQAEAATRAKSEFLAHMSHDIRTPMNGIIGVAELLSYTEMSPRQREYVDMVRASAESLLRLLDDILDLSKIEAGRLELVERELRLHDAVADMLRPYVVQAAAKGVELAHHVAPEVPDVIVGDPDRLRQVVSNLVSNAVKFTDRGEIVVNVEVAERAEGAVVLHATVRDSGVGIAASDQRRIFEAFRQVSSRGGRPGGTGLGLTIAARLVPMMGGRIWVESEPGAGSTFHFTARFGIAEARERPAREAESPAAPPEAPREVHPLRVLVVDDNPINQRIAVELLRRRGHEAQVAGDGSRALERIAAERFDCVLMDVEMPVMDGLRATAALRARERETCAHVPVIAMTAYAMKGDRERMLAAGMDDYVAKPVRPAELYAAVERSGAPAHRARAEERPPSLDLDLALSRAGGQRELFRELAAMFAEQRPALLAELHEAVEARDARTLRRSAHTLKGSLALFGASEATRLAADLERMGREGALQASAERLEELEAELVRVEAELARATAPPSG